MRIEDFSEGGRIPAMPARIRTTQKQTSMPLKRGFSTPLKDFRHTVKDFSQALKDLEQVEDVAEQIAEFGK